MITPLLLLMASGGRDWTVSHVKSATQLTCSGRQQGVLTSGQKRSRGFYLVTAYMKHFPEILATGVATAILKDFNVLHEKGSYVSVCKHLVVQDKNVFNLWGDEVNRQLSVCRLTLENMIKCLLQSGTTVRVCLTHTRGERLNILHLLLCKVTKATTALGFG